MLRTAARIRKGTPVTHHQPSTDPTAESAESAESAKSAESIVARVLSRAGTALASTDADITDRQGI